MNERRVILGYGLTESFEKFLIKKLEYFLSMISTFDGLDQYGNKFL